MTHQTGPQRVRTLVDGLEDSPNALTRMLALFSLCLSGDLDFVQQCAQKGSHHADRGNERFANGLCLDFLADPNSDALKQKLEKAAEKGYYAHFNIHFTFCHDQAGGP